MTNFISLLTNEINNNFELSNAHRAHQMRYIFRKCAEAGYTASQMRRIAQDVLQYNNAGAVYNVWKKWNDARNGATTTATPAQPITPTQPTAQPVEVDYNAFTFGVEFEGGFKTAGGINIMLTMVRDRGLQIIDNRHSADHTDHSDAWKVVYDSSINDFAETCEIVSPVLCGENGWYQLLTMCEIFARVGFGVNRSCGTHVHIGCRDEEWSTIASVAVTYNNAYTAYDSIVAPSRRGAGRWCKPYSPVNIAKIANSVRPSDVFRGDGPCADVSHTTNHYVRSRYHAVNLTAYYQRKTIEFRQHGGTVEFEKISRWIMDKMELITWCRSNRLTEPVTDVRRAPWMSAGTRLYFTARAMWLAR